MSRSLRRPARYLVRFDDICPGMRWDVWRKIETIMNDAGVRPMIAVVPSNQDDNLNVDSPPEPEDKFWAQVRDWQKQGWTIGLHGYQHRYVTREAGLIGINDRSEFAGLSADEQREKLTRAVEIFRERNVKPDVWIAPAHSFDQNTVLILKSLGVDAISDGFFLSEHRDQNDVLWVPQQVWGFRYRPFGTWTVCYHSNSWTDRDLARFAQDLRDYRSQITSFAEIAAERSSVRQKSWHDDVVARMLLGTMSSKRWVRSRLDRVRGRGKGTSSQV